MKKGKTSQILSLILSFVLVLGGAPLVQVTVYAAEKLANASNQEFEESTTETVTHENRVNQLSNIITAVTVNSASLEGNGNKDDPYLIKNAEDLVLLAGLVNSGDPVYNEENVYYRLEDDIDLTEYGISNPGFNNGKGWIPIGKLEYNSSIVKNDGFKGIFDGNNKTIRGLSINDSELDGAGLFGNIYRGKVMRLNLEQVNITGHYYVGGLAGRISNDSRLEDCYVAGSVKGEYYVGGLIGSAHAGSMNNEFIAEVEGCSADVAVEGDEYVGGLAGHLLATVGDKNNSVELKHCYAAGDVKGCVYVGGLVGGVYLSKVENCYATGDVLIADEEYVRGLGYVGGLVGIIRGGTVSNSYATGAVESDWFVGGLAGYIYDDSTITNCYASGAIEAYSYVGGLVGVILRSTVTNCYATSTVKGAIEGVDEEDGIVGGLAGYIGNGTVTNCYATGEVEGFFYVGGLAGIIESTQSGSGSKLENCVALNPSVQGGANTWRVAGYADENTLANNAAFNNMLLNGQTLTDNDDTSINGADITKDEINADGTLGGRFEANSGWTIQNGSLPGLLGTAVKMPNHLSSGNGGSGGDGGGGNGGSGSSGSSPVREAIYQAIRSEQSIATIQVSSGDQISISASDLSLLNENKLALNIKYPSLTIGLNPGSIPQIPGVASLQITAAPISDPATLNPFYLMTSDGRGIGVGYNLTINQIQSGTSTSVTQLNREITLTFELTAEDLAGIDPASLTVYKVDDSGRLTKLGGQYQDGKITVTTSHLCQFFIVGKVAKERLYGHDRYQTAVVISQQGWEKADTVILASGENYPDALTGAVLAGMLDAPVLLTAKDNLNEATLKEIQRLQAKTIIIIGGQAVISAKVEAQLKGSYNVLRLEGTDRFSTAIAVGDRIREESSKLRKGTETAVDTVILATAQSFADALSVAPFAAQKGLPILFTAKDSLNTVTKEALRKWGIKEVIIVGGTEAVEIAVEEELKKLSIQVQRLNGDDRYLTALAIAKHFEAEIGYGKVLVATGEKFPDALAGASLAAKYQSPVLLTSSKGTRQEILDYIGELNIDRVYILGGEQVIPDRVKDAIY